VQKQKLKQLHWQKLQLNQVEGTVWGKSAEEGSTIDFDTLEEMFKLDDPKVVKEMAQQASQSFEAL
jgi:hypothetical protein